MFRLPNFHCDNPLVIGSWVLNDEKKGNGLLQIVTVFKSIEIFVWKFKRTLEGLRWLSVRLEKDKKFGRSIRVD